MTRAGNIEAQLCRRHPHRRRHTFAGDTVPRLADGALASCCPIRLVLSAQVSSVNCRWGLLPWQQLKRFRLWGLAMCKASAFDLIFDWLSSALIAELNYQIGVAAFPHSIHNWTPTGSKLTSNESIQLSNNVKCFLHPAVVQWVLKWVTLIVYKCIKDNQRYGDNSSSYDWSGLDSLLPSLYNFFRTEMIFRVPKHFGY